VDRRHFVAQGSLAAAWAFARGKAAGLDHLMAQWVKAIRRRGGFHQQLDPLTGIFTPDAGGYSPAARVFLGLSRRWRSCTL
jgi:hypothetical protein